MERWDAYTADGVRTGEYLVRGEPIPAGRYHLVAEVLVRHADGRWLLMQRDPEKDYCPGYWEASAGGSALAGEDALTAAHREVLEETGLHIRDLRLIYHEVGDSYLFDYFIAVTEDDPASVTLQSGETVGYRWVDTDTLRQVIADDSACMHARMLRKANVIQRLNPPSPSSLHIDNPPVSLAADSPLYTRGPLSETRDVTNFGQSLP